MRFTSDGIAAFGLLGMIGGLIYAGIKHKELKDISRKLDDSIEELSRKTSVSIRQDILDKAIQKSVDRKVQEMTAQASEQLKKEVRLDMDKKIKSDVDACYSDLRLGVKDRIEEEIGDLDMDDIQKEVKGMLFDKLWGIGGLSRFVGIDGSSSFDVGAIKDVLNTLPSYERANAVKTIFGNYRR